MQFVDLKRREFITLFGAAAAWPLAARAQPPTMPVIGFLHAGSAEQNVQRLAAYRNGLSEAGFAEGQNVAIEFRWADGHVDRLPDMAADLIRRQVAVIATPGSTDAALAAKAATTTIPIVFAAGGNVVALGLVASLSRPGGNVTGATSLNSDIAAKRLGLIRQVVSQEARYFVLVNPTSALAAPFIEDLQAGAASLGLHAELLNASTDSEIDAAFAKLPQQPGTVLLVSTDAFFFSRHRQIVTLSERLALPAMFDNREYAVAGGLMSYGADFYSVLQLAGVYTARILKGEKPADLPVLQSARYEFVINLKTAKALGLTIPSGVLSIADEVIE
jgi:putative tryptophan/tyrosine transport system substrate-binding protein